MFSHPCPHCNCVHRLSIDVAGKVVRCPGCQQMIRLPLLATIVSETLDGLGIPRKYQAPVIGAPQFAGGFARN
jgi:hypothetical protein